jgi:hypothetical protein
MHGRAWLSVTMEHGVELPTLAPPCLIAGDRQNIRFHGYQL